jgi:3-oxoacyl-[acyl-carrier protein] reductase
MSDQQGQSSQKRFVGKVAIVTGAASGIGQATAHQFVQEGAHVAICGDLNMEGLQETARKIEEAGGQCLMSRVDVRKRDEVEAFVKATIEKFGTVDILVNNAGTGQFVPFPNMTEEEYDRVMDTNVRGIFFFCHTVLPTMLEKDYGKIVNVTSVMAEVAAPAQSIYGTSKAAAKMLTQGIAIDTTGRNINVNAVAPGMVLTGLTRNMFSDEKRTEMFLQRIPKRRIGQPEDISSTILFLCSDEASYIHGTTITVDGGMSCTRI